MSTRVVGPSRLFADASAAVLVTVGAWAFVTSTASVERDPFQFASVMAANAKARDAQARSALVVGRTASTCPNNPEAQDQLAPVCMKG